VIPKGKSVPAWTDSRSGLRSSLWFLVLVHAVRLDGDFLLISFHGRDGAAFQWVSYRAYQGGRGHDRLITTGNFYLGVDKRAAKKAHGDFLGYERGE